MILRAISRVIMLNLKNLMPPAEQLAILRRWEISLGILEGIMLLVLMEQVVVRFIAGKT